MLVFIPNAWIIGLKLADPVRIAEILMFDGYQTFVDHQTAKN
jgi:hypothetical protein